MQFIKIVGLALISMVYGINASENQRDALQPNSDENRPKVREIITKENFMIPLVKELIGRDPNYLKFCLQFFGEKSEKNNKYTWQHISFFLAKSPLGAEATPQQKNPEFRDHVYIAAAKFFLATDFFPESFISTTLFCNDFNEDGKGLLGSK